MIVRVDPASAVPVFEQLRVQIERLILSGELPPGSHLPTIRHLAADLALARGTVARVYDVLAREGWVRSAGRRGTVVQGPPEPHSAATSSDLAAAADALAVTARQHGLDDDAAHEALRAALARW